MIRNTNMKNVEEKMGDVRHTILRGQEQIALLLTYLSHKVNYKEDDNNFEGTVEFEFDTEYGGGPIEAETSFTVKNGVLAVDFEIMDFNNLLDWNDIKSNMDDYMGDLEETQEFDANFEDSYEDEDEIDFDW